MKKLLRALAIVTLGLAALLFTIRSGDAEWLEGKRIPPLPTPITLALQPQADASSGLLSSACAVKPSASSSKYRRLPAIREQVPLSRFRQELTTASLDSSVGSPVASPSYRPQEEVILAHPTNFGRRFLQDLNGNPVENTPIVVLHETVGSAQSTINYFQTSHPRDDDQVSYHTLIKEDGTVVYMVPPDRRAFGAGNSVFSGTKDEAVKTNPNFPASVNNFAYHVSLVTPPDGRGNGSSHSGYTRAQYQSLAWLVAKTGLSDSRITSHRLVDRSRQRSDPRSFDAQYFFRLLYLYPRNAEIAMQCSTPAIAQEE
ncbi:peptidoglycan recognition family protein [Myxacorys almedinensis]|uniref:N-acetylmuramoyl-L-alanine amidase n=1 Tax=Myxacorys almedinensis A TaxID=2690445 RepID=A0A8J7Z4Q9_9CYAN|nr:peptidoglycan recognition family protein [Myxacorys almedinensis]NDJ19957.1 N-acetylmuramoyl-L-alanine amidase [Myxacorys almedinensis A]